MSTPHSTRRIGVFTSGGDSQGMNAAVRAVVRTALNLGAEVFAIYEGYQGMIDGGARISARWAGATSAASCRRAARSSVRRVRKEFRTREGRRKAAYNLIANGIDGLIAIGGDGSLTGANLFRQEWPELLAELVAEGAIDQATADAHPYLALVGLVGSIDNDMFGTDMTIGADTALHRIVEAVDAIAATAASHQRSFVVEVMGRHCGYLALMAGLATGANWILIPENPPEDGWEEVMCDAVHAGRTGGRRHNIVLVAEGATDRHGNPISSEYVKQVLTYRLNEDSRVTILGHVQRGGAPSAFDRNMSTMLGYAAVQEILSQHARTRAAAHRHPRQPGCAVAADGERATDAQGRRSDCSGQLCRGNGAAREQLCRRLQHHEYPPPRPCACSHSRGNASCAWRSCMPAARRRA